MKKRKLSNKAEKRYVAKIRKIGRILNNHKKRERAKAIKIMMPTGITFREPGAKDLKPGDATVDKNGDMSVSDGDGKWHIIKPAKEDYAYSFIATPAKPVECPVCDYEHKSIKKIRKEKKKERKKANQQHSAFKRALEDL